MSRKLSFCNNITTSCWQPATKVISCPWKWKDLSEARASCEKIWTFWRKSVLSKLNDQRLKVKMERDSKYHFWLSIGRIWSNFRSFWSPPISNICAGEGNNIWFTFGARYHIRNFSHLLIILLSSCSIYLHQSLDLCERISVRAYIECCDTLPWNPSPNWPVFKTHKQCLTKENDKNKENSIFRTRPSWRTRTRRSSWNWVPCRVRVSAALDP